MNKKATSGFTLIELSVVIVVIAFIIAAIIYGQNLTKKAEAQAVLTEMTNYLGAVSIFRNKYSYRPGDLPSASNFFTGNSVNVTDPSNLRGNNRWDTVIEQNLLWNQLSEAKMISKNIDAVSTATQITLGTNRPKSRFDGSGWTFVGEIDIDPPGAVTSLKFFNVLSFGGKNTANNDEFIDIATFSIVHARYIDTKIDILDTPMSGEYIVDALCVTESGGVYSFSTDTTLDCITYSAELSEANTGTFTP